MIKSILRIYSAIFRYGGLAMAVSSVVVSTWVGIGIARDGYVLVNGNPSREIASIATAVCTPLLGVVVGLALFLLVPKVRPSHGKDHEATSQN
jgi:hypothetical protein